MIFTGKKYVRIVKTPKMLVSKKSITNLKTKINNMENENLIKALSKVADVVEKIEVLNPAGISQKNWVLGYIEGLILSIND